MTTSLNDTSKHARFYIDTVTFRVEDCLFKVPRKPFETESVVFGDMFRLPQGDLQTEEGKNDDDPIHLTGIDKVEFEHLLSVLFHRSYGTCQESLPETNGQWTSVLRLAIFWGFDTIRQAALDHLGQRLSAVDRIRLGEDPDFNLDFESWLLPAMHEIVRRHAPINVKEAERMGLERTLKLAFAREHILDRAYIVEAATKRPNVERVDFSQVIRKIFTTSSG